MKQKILSGKALKKFRLILDISQEELAGRTSMHPTTVSKLENNRGEPSLDTIVALSSAYGIRASELVKEIEET